MPAMSHSLNSPHRPIRSFVLRQGRLTDAQGDLLQTLLPRYRIDPAAPWTHPWGDGRPLALEIGFGNGEHLAALAASRPGWGFIGAEVHGPGVGALLLRMRDEELHNIRILKDDVAPWLATLPDGCLQAIIIQFPDPWPKKRHHKRRLIQPGFAGALARLLAAGGELQLATDWEAYARHMLSILDAEPNLVNTAGPGHFASRPANRIPTRFERRGERLGQRSFDLVYRRRG